VCVLNGAPSSRSDRPGFSLGKTPLTRLAEREFAAFLGPRRENDRQSMSETPAWTRKENQLLSGTFEDVRSRLVHAFD
jgi:hypothetical protein